MDQPTSGDFANQAFVNQASASAVPVPAFAMTKDRLLKINSELRHAAERLEKLSNRVKGSDGTVTNSIGGAVNLVGPDRPPRASGLIGILEDIGDEAGNASARLHAAINELELII